MSKTTLLWGIESCLCWALGLSDSSSRSSGSPATPPGFLRPGKPKSWSPCGVICGAGGLCLRGRQAWEGAGQPRGQCTPEGDRWRHRGVSWLPGLGCSTQVSFLSGPQGALKLPWPACGSLCWPGHEIWLYCRRVCLSWVSSEKNIPEIRLTVPTRKTGAWGNGFRQHLFFTVRGDGVPYFSNLFPQEASEGKRRMKPGWGDPSHHCVQTHCMPLAMPRMAGAGDAVQKDEKTGSLAPRTAVLKSFGVRTFHILINWGPVRTFPWGLYLLVFIMLEMQRNV